MVAAHNVAMYFRIYDLILCAVIDQEIVDPPPRIFLPGMETVAPPGIGPLFVRVQVSERISKASGQKLLKLPPLFVGESCIFVVGLGVLQVDLARCNVQVPADNDRFSAFF